MFKINPSYPCSQPAMPTACRPTPNPTPSQPPPPPLICLQAACLHAHTVCGRIWGWGEVGVGGGGVKGRRRRRGRGEREVAGNKYSATIPISRQTGLRWVARRRGWQVFFYPSFYVSIHLSIYLYMSIYQC